MTNELKSCPFCNYALSMSEGICPAQDCTDEDTGKWTFTGICCPSCAAFLPKKDESSSVPHGVAAWNTRTVPDVPELVRYDVGRHDVLALGPYMDKSKYGEYVRYDQAAEIITAARKSLWDLQEYVKGLRDDLNINRERAQTAEAKLAQIEKQEAVGSLARTNLNNVDVVLFKPFNSDFHVKDGMEVYAAPVASDADLSAKLSDPTAVLINMMRGEIAKPEFDSLQRLYPEIADMRAENIEWLNTQTNLEVTHDMPEKGDLDDASVWKIHSVNGGRNDREWTFVAEHTELGKAITLARAALNPSEPQT